MNALRPKCPPDWVTTYSKRDYCLADIVIDLQLHHHGIEELHLYGQSSPDPDLADTLREYELLLVVEPGASV